MPRLEYFLVCESISTDKDTNRVSLFNIIEGVRVLPPGTPGHILAQFVAVSCWNSEPGDENKDFQAILRINAPGADPKDFEINFTMERPRQRLCIHIQGIPELEPGELKFEMLLNGEYVASHTVNVSSDATASPSTTSE